MRKKVVMLRAITAVLFFYWASPSHAESCKSFDTYEEALAHFKAQKPGWRGLDRDHDQIPCENLPHSNNTNADQKLNLTDDTRSTNQGPVTCQSFKTFDQSFLYYLSIRDFRPMKAKTLDPDKDGIPCECLPGADKYPEAECKIKTKP